MKLEGINYTYALLQTKEFELSCSKLFLLIHSKGEVKRSPANSHTVVMHYTKTYS